MAKNRYFEDEDLDYFSGKTLRRLLKFLQPFRKQIYLSLFLMAAGACASLVGPYLSKTAVDVYMAQGDAAGLIRISILYLGLLGVNAVTLRIRLFIMIRMGNQFIADLREQVFRHVHTLSFRFFDNRPAGKIITRIVNNVDRLQMMVKHGIVNVVTDLLRLVILIVLLFIVNFRMALLTLAVTPFLLLFIFLVKRRISLLWQIVQKKLSNLNAWIHESFTGIKVTQSYVREAKNSAVMKGQLDENYGWWMRAVRISTVMFPVILVINFFAAAIMYIAGYRFLQIGTVTLGTLIAFSQYIWMITDPIVNLGNFYNEILAALSAADRVFELLDTPAEIMDDEGAAVLPAVRGRVEFRDVTFEYDPGFPVLYDVTFTVKPGETIAVVGETGAGKTTIINLLNRFYEIRQGRIMIDGFDIRSVTQESLRARVGTMLQDPFIFSGSVYENIRYGRLDAGKDEITDAARAVHAHDFILSMENGYDTELQERGSRLSVGQKQLIAFARVLLYDPAILVLDEATSSIDTHTERLLQRAVARILQGRTSFVIAHRLSTVQNADRIMVIENGRLVETGTLDELLARQERFYQLYRSQYRKVLNPSG